MGTLPTLTTLMREIDRIKTIQAVVDGELRSGRAAERRGLTDRQLRRLVASYRSSGPIALTLRRCGRPSNHQLPGFTSPISSAHWLLERQASIRSHAGTLAKHI